MIIDFCTGTLLGAYHEDTLLRLRIDVSDNPDYLHSQQPVLVLSLEQAPNPQHALDLVSMHVGHAISFYTEEQSSHPRYRLAAESPGAGRITLECGALSSALEAYILRDLQVLCPLLKQKIAQLQRRELDHQKLVAGIRTAISRGIDVTNRKLQHFAGSKNVGPYEHDKRIYEGLLRRLVQLEDEGSTAA